MFRPLSILVVLCSVLFTTVAAQTSKGLLHPGEPGPGPIHRFLVPIDEEGENALLSGQDGLVGRRNYEAFTQYLVDDRVGDWEGLLAAAGSLLRDDMDFIPLSGHLLDGAHPMDLLSSLSPEWLSGDIGAPNLPVDAGLYLIQFDGPIADSDRSRIDALGLDVVQYVPFNAYVLSLSPEEAVMLDGLSASLPSMRLAIPYHPAFRVTPSVREAARTTRGVLLPMTVQLVDGDGVRSAMDFIVSLGGRILHQVKVGPYLNLMVDLDPAQVRDLAHHPRVFAIEERHPRRRLDERQGQIVAGNVSGASLGGPNYLSWLSSHGFNASQFSSFSVNVVDDATSLGGHPDLPSTRVDFQLNPTSQSGPQEGHGFLNAQIIAGFNNGTGSAVEDSGGYNYGLGIAPWSHVGSTAIFGNSNATGTSWESSAYAQGARISSNSWGFGGPIADYDSSAQEYDFIVRDARGSQSGLQELSVIFAAGNDGPGPNTVGSPSTAKNIITVGASENVRQTGTDGCGTGNGEANNANDLVGFSSRGPVNASGGDGRWKPEIVAPGTHIQAGVPQSNYNGLSICDQYFPLGQTLYGWSSGTSHSTPAVAAGAALIYQDSLNNGLGAPSPALQKAILVNTAEYLTGFGANDTLPSNKQGMGRMNLGRAFDGAPKIRVDQTQTLATTGSTYTLTGSVQDPSKPFRVTLCWTDAPGPTTGAPWVNDLDLTVTIGGSTYRGNRFSGALSTTGGTADVRNNTESVFLPAGTTGSFTVTVTAANIAGDGVPGNADATDQDFALFVYNGSSGGPIAPVADFTGTPTSGMAPLTVAFTDLTTGSASSWSWNFGDGSTSVAQNPTHTYTATGTYTVTLTATGPGGTDSATKANYITVSPAPAPGIQDGDFESQTSGTAPSGAWTVDFGTGHIINPAGGTSSDNGLPSSGSKWCEVAADSTDNATPPSNPGGTTAAAVGGAGISQSFTIPSGSHLLSFEAAFLRNEGANQATFNDWMSVDVSDGTTVVNVYYADTFTAAPLTSSKYGYAMTAVQTVSVDLLALFPASTSSTLFTITVQVGNGGDNVQPSKGYVDNFALSSPVGVPTAGFSATPTSGTAPLTVSFTDSSTGSITSRVWNFGDGTTSAATNPTHVYASAGVYTPSLTVVGPGGSDTFTATNLISVGTPPPTADFGASPLNPLPGQVVQFTPMTTGSVTTYLWSFGDGTSSSLASPVHTYLTPGSYDVTLTVTGPGGTDSLTKPGYITVTATGGERIYVSFRGTTTLPGLGAVEDEDIVFYDTATGLWSMYMDGSDLGLAGTDVNAFHVFPNGAVAFSIDSASYSLSTLLFGPNGTIMTENDLAYWLPTSTGSTTAGSVFFIFDGSDVGLDTSAEDIDGLYFAADGSFLLVSTSGGGSVQGGLNFADEDVLFFLPQTYFTATSGTWLFAFDGSDVALGDAGEDLDALHFDDNSAMLFSTDGVFSATGSMGADEDIAQFVGPFGVTTSGTVSLAFDMSTMGVPGSADVDAVTVVPNP
ncbi:MAG TPA: PKD domain-containing protein [Planctomycetes bacterium]|nr:PKD domain-containing protein [Planctomycetota bacterium]